MTVEPSTRKGAYEQLNRVSTVKLIALTAVILPLALPAFALDGQIQIHDPSTIVRCAVINGGGATDFCARFLDAEDKPLKRFTLSVGAVAK